MACQYGNPESMGNKRDSGQYSDIDDVCLWVNGESMTDISNQAECNSMLLVTSCIFHNFTSVCRAGVNSTFVFQKSVLKDSKGISIHAVNPKAVLIDRCNIQNPKKTGILIDWLRASDQMDVGRTVFITGNEICNGSKEGILIQSYLQFSAHNLKIII